jgi:serine/threonine protein kinase
LKELKYLAQLKSDYVVKLVEGWIESNGQNEKFGYTLFIQMELCFHTLKKLITYIYGEKSNLKKKVKFYVLSQIFIEILEGVNYLHKQNPPIIHRDLKPANILISYGIDGRFVKIADLGLATPHERDDQSHTSDIGTVKYMAIEVLNSRNYDITADIHSLGVIAQGIFNFSIENK